MRGTSRRADSSMAACTSSSGRFTLTRPACTMRARGALAAEHILTAFATSPARMHFCIVARNTSLLMDEPYRYSALSTMTPIVMMDQKRITYMPQPPSLKCFQTAAIEPSSVFCFSSGIVPDARLRDAKDTEQLRSNKIRPRARARDAGTLRERLVTKQALSLEGSTSSRRATRSLTGETEGRQASLDCVWQSRR